MQAALNAFASSGDGRNRAVALVAQLRAELADTGSWVAAFDDLLATAQDPDASHDVVSARLDVLTGVLELGDRSAGEICRLLGGVVDDQALEISYAQHEVYGSPVRELERVDETAGLADDERLDLCRLYLQTAATPGHHVVWVAYGDAQIGPGDWRARVEDWRARVGPVEFFDGPTLVQDSGVGEWQPRRKCSRGTVSSTGRTGARGVWALQNRGCSRGLNPPASSRHRAM